MSIKNIIKHLVPVSRRKFDIVISERDEIIADCAKRILDLENSIGKVIELSEFVDRLDVKMTDILKFSVEGAGK